MHEQTNNNTDHAIIIIITCYWFNYLHTTANQSDDDEVSMHAGQLLESGVA